MTSEKTTFDIMRHTLVPQHTIVSEEEAKELFKEYDLTTDQLPKILDTDSVAAFIEAKPGQIIKIVRKSHTAKRAVAYRFVVESNK